LSKLHTVKLVCLTLVLTFIAACGGTATMKPDAAVEVIPCGPSNCAGCCGANNECLVGTSQSNCGNAGNACASCAGNLYCSAGSCQRFDGGDYDASFPMRPDAGIKDAGVFDAGAVVDAGTVDAGPLDAGPASFANDVLPFLNSKCINCHNFSYTTLVNANSVGSCSTLKRVVPGDAGASVIYTKIVSPICGGAMPPSGSVSSAEITAIRRWIAEGAQNN
jgi:hypothetical protein